MWVTETFEITTDPGSPYLLKPINNYGCAILAPGQWRGCYSIGKHRGQYLALVQSGKVKVFRDNDLDNILDMDPETIQDGYSGSTFTRGRESLTPSTEPQRAVKCSATSTSSTA